MTAQQSVDETPEQIAAREKARRDQVEAERKLRLEEFRQKALDKLEVSELLHGRMKLPKRYRRMNIANYVGKDAVLKIAVDAIERGESVMIGGECGVGKTHLAVACMYAWMRKYFQFGYPEYGDTPQLQTPVPLFLPTIDLFFELKTTFGGHGKTEQEVLDRYTKLPMLVIDDLGAEKSGEWARQDLYYLIDQRYKNEVQTVITSNLTLARISELIDDRIASRINGMGVVIELGGEDRRVSKP